MENPAMKKTSVSIELKNFGPILNGKLELKPLTVLVGPNNSGKSHAAMLLYALWRSFSRIGAVPEAMGLGMNLADVIERCPDISRQLPLLQPDEFLTIPEDLGQMVWDRLSKRFFHEVFGPELGRAFGVPLSELITIGRRKSRLHIHLGPYDLQVGWRADHLEIERIPRYRPGAKKIAFHVRSREESKTSRWVQSNTYDDGDVTHVVLYPRIPERQTEAAYRAVIDKVSEDLVCEMFHGLERDCFYLPAARSAVLQILGPLEVAIIDQWALGKREPTDHSRMQGVVSDFLVSVVRVLRSPGQKSEFYDLAHEFEDEILSGRVDLVGISRPDGHAITFSSRGAVFPLHRVASSVSELAPFFLYLQYVVRSGDILIVEEPESHLHPAAQRILAECLVRLIRSGLFVVLTTHSDFLLEQLNHFIMMHSLPPSGRPKARRTKESFLRPDEVAAHVLQYDQESKGYRMANLEVTPEDGIPEDEFVKVQESLYEELYSIEAAIHGGE